MNKKEQEGVRRSKTELEKARRSKDELQRSNKEQEGARSLEYYSTVKLGNSSIVTVYQYSISMEMVCLAPVSIQAIR